MIYYLFILLWRIISGRDEMSTKLISKQVVTFECIGRLLDVFPDIVKYEFGQELHLIGRVGGEMFDPIIQLYTDTIVINDTSSEKIRIKWEKFPYLKKLIINTSNVDYTNIDFCKNLTSLQIKNKHL